MTRFSYPFPSRRETFLGLGAAFTLAACQANVAAGSSPQTTPKGWSEGDPLPVPLQEIYPCLHRGAIHLAGGFIASGGQITGPTDAHLVWRPDGQGWRPAPSLPKPRHHPHLASFNGNLIVLGGYESPSPERIWQAQSTGWILNDATQSWDAAPPLPLACGEAVMLTGSTGNLHLAGGRSPNDQNASWADQIDQTHHLILDSPTGKWQRAAPCLTARNSASGALIGTNLHIVGGRSVEGGNTNAHEVYDSAEDRWRTAAPMPQAQAGLAAAELGGKLYAFGGEFFENGGGVFAESWVYDPTSDSWNAIAPMPHPRHGLGAVTLEGVIHVIGGALKVGGNETSPRVEIYRP